MSASPTPTHPAGLTAAALDGTIVLPGHARFDEARLAWNLAVDQRPAAVAFPNTAHDVAAAIRLAREHRLQIAAQGTGHNAGPLGSLENTILLKTERMRGVRIDPQARIARVEAGVLWLEVVEAAARHGLAALAGSSPDVGVVGYTLGGGLSFLGRKHGLSANAVRAIEVVTADGRLRRCDRDHEPDLFWALRGGGGSFGVVTAIELELFPIAQAYAGVLSFPIERGGEVLHAWRELTHSAEMPDELTTVGRFLRVPAKPEIPEAMRGRAFAIVEAYHLGDPAQADELLAPLRALGPVNDTIQTVPMPALSHLHMDPAEPVPAAGDGMLLAELPAQAVDALVEVAGEAAPFPLVTVEVRHLGGALARPHASHGALASLDAGYSLFAAGMVPVPQFEAPTRAQVDAVKAAMGPWAASRRYLNLADTPGDPATFWNESTLHRLRRIKRAVDPDGLIRSNHPVHTTSGAVK
jgi:hypothetical protein